MHYKDYYIAAQEAYQDLQKEAEVIIGLIHISLEQDKKLAKDLTDVRLIIGGHEHFNMLVLTTNGVIAKADANAKTIYIHTVQYNLETKETNIHSTLMSIDDKIGMQTKTQEVVEKWQTILETELKEFIEEPNEIIYFAEEALDGTDDASRSKQTNLGQLIAKAMAEAYENTVDAVIVNGGLFELMIH